MTPDLSGLGAWAQLPFFGAPYQTVLARLAQQTDPVFPEPNRIFRALNLCQPEQTRVVILGQDPYHTKGKADGLAFSIPQGFGGRLDSLGNIFKELESDLHISRTCSDLTDWAEQGVLLLNTALTVTEGRAHAHKSLGWTPLIHQVLDHLSVAPRAFVLWGKPAQRLGARVNGDHLKIETAHPSPLSAHRGFFGSHPFSRVNHWLASRGEAPINWG